MRTVIVAARRMDGGQRDKLWAFAITRWRMLGWPIIEEMGPDGDFNRAAAINQAAARAGMWDVMLIVDADVVLDDPAQALAAAELASRSGRVVFAHDSLTMFQDNDDRFAFSQDAIDATGQVLKGEDPAIVADSYGFTVHPNTWSSALAVPRVLWDKLGGFDERFAGWGWEDIAFRAAAKTLAGGIDRVPGRAFHLWHPRSWETNEANPGYAANQVLGERYQRADGDPYSMRQLIAERGQSSL